MMRKLVLDLAREILVPAVSSEQGYIPQNYKKGGPSAGKPSPNPGGPGTHCGQAFCAISGQNFFPFFGVPSNYGGDFNLARLFAFLMLSCLEAIGRNTGKCGDHFTGFV
ncbi:hypothetical protein DSO57_1035774 [Entomophthora muscae]|uniref:Uncharacterized protein n=1 Tax=Entomophthora muscae TaxID=34485 RepID=A0ACC2SNQ1_9FUNG|nr:hypothetical protein DSO57_1035774 [Entomophthora muscae]